MAHTEGMNTNKTLLRIPRKTEATAMLGSVLVEGMTKGFSITKS